ncbi:MAG: hypothetical protein IJV40_03670 [Oscillospiraceae bacterium]|nr:hypothetical protein [Oscillospiraceae bacterium]
MIQKALQYLVGLKDNKTYVIGGKTYSDNQLHYIEEPIYKRRTVEFGSLDAIVKMIKTELPDYDGPLFVRITNHKCVDVITRPNKQENRMVPYSAHCTDTEFMEGWREQDKAIIELRSRFLPTEDSDYLINLVSRINNDEGVKTEDNGVSQTVVVKKGVQLAATEAVKPRLNLTPFRTFREVPQPMSEFILRLDENGRIGLFEADGGMWKIEAKINIQTYLETALADEVKFGAVVIMI